MSKLMSTKDYVLNMIKDREQHEAVTESVVDEAAEMRKQIFDIKNSFNESRMTKSDFLANTRRALLTECVYRLYDACVNVVGKNDVTRNAEHSIVESFIEEQGVNNLLRKFKTGSSLLSEFSYIVDKYYSIIKEEVDEMPELKIKDETKDNFYDELDAVDAEDVVFSVRNRVMDAMNEFIDKNNEDKLKIKEILTTSKEKIDTAKNDQLREAYEFDAKRKISEIEFGGKQKNVFECMVRNMCKDAYINEEAKAIYFENGSINMDKIVENCEVLYTFLELANTSRMIEVDNDYIMDIIKHN